MKNEILKFLKQDYLNNLDLIYALEHDAKIKYYNQAGIMLKFEDIYMLAFKDEKIAEQLLKQIDKCSMLAIHNDKYFNIINQKWRLNKEIVAYQYGYLKKYVRIINNPIVEIKEIGREYFEFIKENYSTPIEEAYLLERIDANVFVGAFIEKQIVGFAGRHIEGTIGFVEVIKEYRRLGIAQALEQYLMQKLIAENEIIYLQVEVDNYPSMRLHEKLGYERSDDIITWYM